MAFIDGTITNVALPQIQDRLSATAVDAQWIVESYSLFLAALILVGGSLGDHYGRRRIFLLGVTIFTLASMACGLSLTPGQLIVARAVQGVGGALLVPGSLAIIGASFSEENRGKAIGTWSGFSGITTAIGPILGGYLVDNVSWRAAFFFNMPLAVVVIHYTTFWPMVLSALSGNIEVHHAAVAPLTRDDLRSVDYPYTQRIGGAAREQPGFRRPTSAARWLRLAACTS